jgi:hypothetical protein
MPQNIISGSGNKSYKKDPALIKKNPSKSTLSSNYSSQTPNKIRKYPMNNIENSSIEEYSSDDNSSISEWNIPVEPSHPYKNNFKRHRKRTLTEINYPLASHNYN